MEKQVRSLIVPEYLTRFACTGSKCEDNCCAAGWRIDIDRTTYEKYMKIQDKHWKQRFNMHLNVAANTSDSQCAVLKMDKHGACPFLSEEGLCQVQFGLGTGYLSDICACYPRVTYVFNGQYERAGTISCPEMARLVLLNPQPLRRVMIEEALTERCSIRLNSNIKSDAFSVYQWREIAVNILQSRMYSMDERMVILGVFMDRISKLITSKQWKLIAPLMDGTRESLVSGRPKELHFAISSEERSRLQFLILNKLMDIRLSQKVSSKSYLECYEAFVAGLTDTRRVALDKIVHAYREAYSRYYRPFEQKNEYIFENYAVNYVYKNLFPYNGYPNPFDEYILLALHYSLIKIHLVGMSGYYRESLSREHVIKLMYSFSRTVEHNWKYLEEILTMLKDSGNAHMTCMAALIVYS